MKVLFIGGTGIISSACSQLAVQRGIDLYLLTRGQSARPVPPGAHVIAGDIRQPQAKPGVRQALKGHTFDAVVQWVAFEATHIQTDIELFQGITGQYVFISSASAYQTPPASLPVTESTPLHNPYWAYSRAKIACEERLLEAYRHEQFPLTIVRPSHTYDKTMLPVEGGYTAIARMRQGKPVIVPGDGTSLWTLTHHADFAVGLVGLLGNPQALGQAFHITSDEWLTWNQIYEILAHAAGCEARLVHVPSDLIAAYDPEWGAGQLGDKMHSMVFDNRKVRRLVPDFNPCIPFARGAQEMLAWYDGDPQRQIIDPAFNALVDRILAAYQSAWPR
ncbi:MAG: SDR family oxidoreductase [Chloroflexota bacterium]